MDIIHFTPGALDSENVQRHGFVAHMPLAAGAGELELSCLYLAPGGGVAVPRARGAQLLLFVNGKAAAHFDNGMLLELSAGMGLLLQEGEQCRLSCATGAVVLVLAADRIGADACGISAPERVMGQLWPTFESN